LSNEPLKSEEDQQRRLQWLIECLTSDIGEQMHPVTP
jgi:hypothetical protein